MLSSQPQGLAMEGFRRGIITLTTPLMVSRLPFPMVTMVRAATASSKTNFAPGKMEDADPKISKKPAVNLHKMRLTF